MSQHILHQNPIPTRRILNKNVRDCSDEFSVLDDGAAAHALDDPAGQGQKFRIGYADDHVLVVAVGGVVYFLNLNLVVFQFPGHAAASFRFDDRLINQSIHIKRVPSGHRE